MSLVQLCCLIASRQHVFRFFNVLSLQCLLLVVTKNEAGERNSTNYPFVIARLLRDCESELKLLV